MTSSTRDRFLASWPAVKQVLLDAVQLEELPAQALDWFGRVLDYNVPGGKLNRGSSVVDTFQILKGQPLSSHEFENAAVLGWCVELLQAYFLVADDIMDRSVTRRGHTCWYRIPEVGNIAINDAFLLESAIYILLKKHFRNESYYVTLLELFHDTTFQTTLGQLIDLTTASEDVVDLDRFSLEKHHLIVKYKTAFYSFYLPVAAAMRLYGMTSPTDPGHHLSINGCPKSNNPSKAVDVYRQALDILVPLGVYFQVQDDYLDCFGDPKLIGKIGTDIVDNKCSWNVNIALKHCTADQRKVLDAHYGRKDSESEERVKQIFRSDNINLTKRFEEYEAESYKQINQRIKEIDNSAPNGLKQEVFTTFLAKIYKRSK